MQCAPLTGQRAGLAWSCCLSAHRITLLCSRAFDRPEQEPSSYLPLEEQEEEEGAKGFCHLLATQQAQQIMTPLFKGRN